MTDTPRNCQRCGATLTGDAPSGNCPACLMQLAMATAAGRDPAAASAPGAGEVRRFGDYELIEPLGRGGMGIWAAMRRPLICAKKCSRCGEQGLALTMPERCSAELAKSYRDRGHDHCIAGRSAEAVADFHKATRLDPGSQSHWYEAAAVSLWAGDLDRYRSSCREVLDRFEKLAKEQPEIAERTAGTCALAADSAAGPSCSSKA